MTRITLIRHGQTSWNVDGRWQGQANVGLNDEGFRQAEQLAAAYVDTDAVALYSSDLRRAAQTAEAIARQSKLSVTFDMRLREIDMGDWQGMTGAEAELWDGQRLAAVRAGGFEIRRPGGESQHDVAARITALVDEVAERHHGKHVLLVSHGGTIRILLHTLKLLNESHGFIENTSRSVIELKTPDSRWRLDLYNALDHLSTHDALGAIHNVKE